MYRSERQQEILAILREKGFVSVEALAAAIHISESSIRRDLQQLENLGLVKRSYGGASVVGADYRVPPISLRSSVRHAEKNAIAQKAATLIADGNSLVIDWSTTAQHLVPYLTEFSDLVVVTNNLRTCKMLVDNKINTYCTGGQFLYDPLSMIGPDAERMLAGIHVDWLFFSALCVDLNGDIYEPYDLERSLRLQMLKIAKKKVFMIDSSKLFDSNLYKVANLNDVDYVVCDCELDESFKKKFPRTVFL